MQIKETLLVIFSIFLFTSCSVSPQPIKVGQDECANCRMKIMDARYGAEIVTKKNKAFKFDSFECMEWFRKADNVKKEDIALNLVVDFKSPNSLFNIEEATYLISDSLPSPMGAFITVFLDKEEAKKTESQFKGELVDYAKASAHTEKVNSETEEEEVACCHDHKE